MLSSLVRGSIALLCFVPPALCAQYDPIAPPAAPNVPGDQQSLDPRQQRAERERAVATVGVIAREFVETYGEDAVAAIFACPQPVALQLTEFHASGGLGRLPRPRDLLRVIGKPNQGGDVAVWAMAHVGELTDADNFDAYLLEPLSYALSLKKLEEGATAIRERRQQSSAALAEARTAQSAYGWRMVGLGSGATALIALFAWRGRQRLA